MPYTFKTAISALMLPLVTFNTATAIYGQNADTGSVKVHLRIYDSLPYTCRLERAYSTEYYNRDSSIAITSDTSFTRQADLNGQALPGINIYTLAILRSDGKIIFRLPYPMKGGDSISVDITSKKIPGWGNRIITTGSNGAAHNFMMQYPNTLSTKVFESEPEGLQPFYESAHRYIDSICAAFGQVCLNSRVDLDCREFYLADLKSKLYHETLEELGTMLHRDSLTYERGFTFLNLKNLIFYEGKAANPLLLKTFHGFLLYNSYLSYIMEINPVTDTTLSRAHYSFYSLYDSSYRSFAWGQALYYGYKMSPRQALRERFQKDPEFKAFKQLNPASSFIPFLEQYVYGHYTPSDGRAYDKDSLSHAGLQGSTFP